jgi:hypothetical protein
MSNVLAFPAKAKAAGRRRVRPIPDMPMAEVRGMAEAPRHANPAAALNDAEALREIAYHLLMAVRAINRHHEAKTN